MAGVSDFRKCLICSEPKTLSLYAVEKGIAFGVPEPESTEILAILHQPTNVFKPQSITMSHANIIDLFCNRHPIRALNWAF